MGEARPGPQRATYGVHPDEGSSDLPRRRLPRVPERPEEGEHLERAHSEFDVQSVVHLPPT